jgi:hypothetical protein
LLVSVLVFICIYYFTRSFLQIDWFGNPGVSYDVFERVQSSYGKEFIDMLLFSSSITFLIFLIDAILATRGILRNKHMDNTVLILFFSGIIVSILSIIPLVIFLPSLASGGIVMYGLRSVLLLPQVLSISLALLLVHLKGKTKRNFLLDMITVMLVFLIICFSLNGLNFVTNRKPLLNDDKYDVMLFVRKNVTGSVLVLYPSYGFENFLYRNYTTVSSEEFKSILGSKDISPYTNYSNVILPPIGDLISKFYQENYSIVKQSSQVIVMAKNK